MMLSEQFLDLIKQKAFLLKMLWVGEFATIGIFAVIAYVTNQDPSTKPPDQQVVMVMTAVLVFMSLWGIGFAFLIKRMILSPKAVSAFLNGRPSGMLRLFSQQPRPFVLPEEADALSEQEKKLLEYNSRIFVVHLMQWGALLGCSIYGFVLSTVMHNFVVALPFFAVNAVLHLALFPNLTTLYQNGLEKAMLQEDYRG